MYGFIFHERFKLILAKNSETLTERGKHYGKESWYLYWLLASTFSSSSIASPVNDPRSKQQTYVYTILLSFDSYCPPSLFYYYFLENIAFQKIWCYIIRLQRIRNFFETYPSHIQDLEKGRKLLNKLFVMPVMYTDMILLNGS